MGNRSPQVFGGRRSLSFSKTLWLSLFIAGILLISFYSFFNHYTEDDRRAYQDLIAGEAASDSPETHASEQKRLGLQKDFFSRGGQHLRLTSASSRLAVEKTGHHFAIVEHLQGVTCCLKDSEEQDAAALILTTDHATYDYRNELFTAEQVVVKRTGKAEEEENTIAQGTAKKVALSSTHHGVEIQAENCKADFALLSGQGSISANQVDMRSTPQAKNIIQSIRGEGDVVFRYADNYTATADVAVFERDSTAPAEEALAGTITLSCMPKRLCHISSLGGDAIDSKEIIVDTVQQELLMTHPEGSLKGLLGIPTPLDFAAEKMTWKEKSSQLTLSGQVRLSRDGLEFHGENDVRLALQTVDGKRTLRDIETEGKSLLTYIDRDIYLGHVQGTHQEELFDLFTPPGIYVLQTYGTLKIDHQKQDVKLKSPENRDGTVQERLQVHFRDAKGEMYADRAFLKYEEIDQKVVPTRIVLQGNVKITTAIPAKKAESDEVTNPIGPEEKEKKHLQQYVLADRVDFIPQSKEMIVKAAKGKRVLLFDQASNLEVSAPGLKLTRDKAMQKEAVEGIGDVRFNFVEAESEQFRRHFSFEKRTGHKS